MVKTGIKTKDLMRLLKKHDFIDVENKGFKRLWND